MSFNKKALISIFSLLLVGCVSNNNTSNVKPPFFVAHRGYSRDYIDNTEKSFIEAGKRSFYGIETDVRKTKDAIYVCNHDGFISYMNTKYKINEYTYEYLSTLPLDDSSTFFICFLLILTIYR